MQRLVREMHAAAHHGDVQCNRYGAVPRCAQYRQDVYATEGKRQHCGDQAFIMLLQAVRCGSLYESGLLQRDDPELVG